ncbi:39S ribosomal protein L55, mitochondrial [Condylostylus longicornis]|uniref:39S ribosomal protein L55, mitochondrial n=1 Tax=Condylostylus longicornis TaxID=2530218 RepID=UPI00244D9F01|nr:39S ribosomal protein L55, mitochondrial [Condylostylus longicornis]
MFLKCLVKATNISFQNFRTISSATAAITKIKRPLYCRQYPVVIVNSDGSSINIRYSEPRKIIKLPLNINTLSESERKARIEARKAKKKVIIEAEMENTFDSKKYLKFLKK